jgi:hypothetical protein
MVTIDIANTGELGVDLIDGVADVNVQISNNDLVLVLDLDQFAELYEKMKAFHEGPIDEGDARP